MPDFSSHYTNQSIGQIITRPRIFQCIPRLASPVRLPHEELRILASATNTHPILESHGEVCLVAEPRVLTLDQHLHAPE